MGVVLSISAVGMSLLFLALAFFYGLLLLLTSVVRDRGVEPGCATEKGAEPAQDEALLQAAAIAIALARAEAEMAPSPDAAALPLPVSPWWALYHQRRLASPTNARRL